MKRYKNFLAGMVITMMLALLARTNALMAQAPGIKRTDLQRHDLSAPGREVIQVRVDFDPGAAFGRHKHPGEEVIYVLEGSLVYQIAGKPDVTLKPGEVLFIPAGVVHSAKNVGTANAKELATYIVKKGRPLITLINP